MFHPSRQLQNERGQAMTVALVFLPVALTLFCGAMFFAYAFVLEAKATAACRSSLMKNQTRAAEAINNLLALNTEAKWAERGVQTTKAALRLASASGVPPAIITAQVAYEGALVYQLYVMARQKRWLLQGRLASRLATIDAANDVRKALPDGTLTQSIQTMFNDFSAISTPRAHTPLFHVIASPPNARTPTYRTAPNFEKTQEASVQWLLPVPLPRTRTFQGGDHSKAFAPKVEIGCAVALKKNGGGRWYPQIVENKLVRD